MDSFGLFKQNILHAIPMGISNMKGHLITQDHKTVAFMQVMVWCGEDRFESRS